MKWRTWQDSFRAMGCDCRPVQRGLLPDTRTSVDARPSVSDTDIDLTRRLTVINETLAQKYFENEDPIGQKVRFDVLDRLPVRTTP